MSEYRVTFGVKYRDEPHPLFPPAHPDGWLAIHAPSRDLAERIAYGMFTAPGGSVAQFAFFYDMEVERAVTGPRADERWAAIYPRGEIARITLEVKEG